MYDLPLEPPDDPRYCPLCLANVDDGERESVGTWDLVHCPECGAVVNSEQTISHREARQQYREDAADWEHELDYLE